MYDGKYAPLGEHLCFVKATPSEVLAAFDSWYKKLNWGGTPYEGYEGKFEIYNVSGTLIDVFQSLSPYDNDLKMALIPTNSEWTAFMSSRPGLGLLLNACGVLLSNPVIIVRSILSDFGKKTNGWGGGAFSISEGFNRIRGISLMMNDFDRWEFNTSGNEQPFEETEKYKERFVKNRFTPDMLDRYLKHFGINYYDENFYMPAGSIATLIELKRPMYDYEFEKSLEQLRTYLMYE
jgi:hypothetical protein